MCFRDPRVVPQAMETATYDTVVVTQPDDVVTRDSMVVTHAVADTNNAAAD